MLDELIKDLVKAVFKSDAETTIDLVWKLKTKYEEEIDELVQRNAEKTLKLQELEAELAARPPRAEVETESCESSESEEAIAPSSSAGEPGPKKKTRPRKILVCQMCGRQFEAAYKSRQYCDDCRKSKYNKYKKPAESMADKPLEVEERGNDEAVEDISPAGFAKVLACMG